MQVSLAAMCATGLEALSVNFAVQTANHMGRLDKAFKAVTTPEALTDLAITAITAGAFKETTKHLKLPAQPKGLEAIAKNQFLRARIEMDVRILFGEKPKTAAKKAFKAASINTVSGFLSQKIGHAYQKNLLDDNNNNNPHNVVDNTAFELPPLTYAEHKFAHFWAGVLAGGLSTIGESQKKLFQNMWTAGAAETFAEVLCDISHKSPQELYQEVAADLREKGQDLNPTTYRQGLAEYAQRRANIAQMLTATTAFLLKQDINLAYTTARIATQENAVPFIVAVGLYALATAGAVHSGLEIKKAYDQDGTPGALKQGAIEVTQYAAGYAAGKAIAIVGKPVAGYLMAKWGDQILLISDKTWQLFKQMNPALAFQVERAASSSSKHFQVIDQKAAQWLHKATLKLEQKGSAAVERTAISPVGNRTGVTQATTVTSRGERSANGAVGYAEKAQKSYNSRQARREAMRQENIPTSQQPVQQINTVAGRQLVYEVPGPGGTTVKKIVTEQTTDRVPGHGPHWESGNVKQPERLDGLKRLRVTNQKTKIDFQQ